jgi:hypothetical protein
MAVSWNLQKKKSPDQGRWWLLFLSCILISEENFNLCHTIFNSFR